MKSFSRGRPGKRDGEIVETIHVPAIPASAHWGYAKSCRKTGDFAHAIGAYFHDPDRSVCRAVIGAIGGKPIVFTDARALFGGSAGSQKRIDRKLVEQAMNAHGLTDPIEQQMHFACLRRAIDQAERP